MKIKKINPVVLTAPYSDPTDSEILVHLPGGVRNCGLVEIELENGVKGVGEGYMAVFAPEIFASFIRMYARQLEGQDGYNITRCYRECCRISDYFSFRGAARHAISAVEMALWDAKGKSLGVPVYDLLGGRSVNSIEVYASGGDCTLPEKMEEELLLCRKSGINILKIRSDSTEVRKTSWTMAKAVEYEIRIAVDMCQNLAVPSQTVADALTYLERVNDRTGIQPEFLEEALGPNAVSRYPELRHRTEVPLAGGETLTSAEDFFELLGSGYLDYIQPDSSVMGGISQIFNVCRQSESAGINCIVHNWGSSVSMMANYHAAFAAGCRMAEWPIKNNPLREALYTEKPKLEGGRATLPETPGLGVELTEEIKEKYSFKAVGTYNCNGDSGGLPPDESWPSL